LSELPIKRSDGIGQLVMALAAAQLGFAEIQKTKENTFNHSWYADLADVIAATRPSLAKNGLTVIQVPVYSQENPKLAGAFSLLAHQSGEFISTELILPAEGRAKDNVLKLDSQTIAAAITYAKRYTWQALVGVAAEEDDDAQSLADRAPDPRQPAPPTKAPKAPTVNPKPAATGGERPQSEQKKHPDQVRTNAVPQTKPEEPVQPPAVQQPAPPASALPFDAVSPVPEAQFPLPEAVYSEEPPFKIESKPTESTTSAPDTSEKPTKSQLDTYIAKIRDDIRPALEKAGLKASKNKAVGAKLKDYLLSAYGNSGAKEITDLTIKQWDAFIQKYESTDTASFALLVEGGNK